MLTSFGSRLSIDAVRRQATRAGSLVLVAIFVVFGAFVAPSSAQDPAGEVLAPDAPIVHRISVVGKTRYDHAQLIGALGQSEGSARDLDAITRGTELLWELHHLHVNVYQRDLELNGVLGIELLIVPRELPYDLEPRFVGNVDIDLEELYEWARLQPGQELYLDQADRVRERVLRAYRNDGYYFAEVRAVKRLPGVDEGTGAEIVPDVIFEIREGPKVRVKDIVIEGNESISNRNIVFLKRGLSKLAGMKMRGPRFFGIFKKAFVEETLEADLIGLRQVYRDQGWLNAVVGLQPLEFSKDRSWVTIRITIDEGERYTIGSLSIEGVQYGIGADGRPDGQLVPATLEFTEEELSALLETKPGDFYERSLHGVGGRDQLELRKFYGERGYIYHRSLPSSDRWEFLEPELLFEEDESAVHVIYRISQGKQIFLREIRTTGNLHTRDRVIRDLITLDEGDIANPVEIERSRARLESRGWFSDPSNPLEHIEPYYRFENTADPNWKDLVFVVEEGQVIRFNISGGVSSNTGVFGVISYTQQNFDITSLPESFGSLIGDVASRKAFHGAGQQLTLQASPGTEISFFDISFSDPDIFRRHRERISGTVTARRRRHILRSHEEERQLVSFQIGRQLTIDSSIYGGYGFETVEVSDLDTGGQPTLGSPLNVPQLLKDQEGESDLGHVKFGYRLRTVDNRMSPRNGVSFTWNNEFHSEALGGDHEFIKSELRFEFYDEFDEDSEVVSDRYHFGVRAQVAYPYGISDNVPYSERYHAGGHRIGRGFRYRGIGPNERGYPIGGETMLYATFDYRRPLVTTTQPGTYREIETFHGGVFVDAVILDPDAFELDFDEVRASVGIAFGIAVPLPITFSFGFPIKDGQGDRKQVFAFNIGF